MNFLRGLLTENVVLRWVVFNASFVVTSFRTCSAILCMYCSSLQVSSMGMPSTLRSIDCSISSFGQLRLPDEFGLEVQVCKLLSVSRSMLTVWDLAWTHDSLSFTFGRSRGVSCLANNYLFPLSLPTLTTLSFGTDWYIIMELELVCQNSRPASCAVDKWIQYTASCSGIQWIWYCTFLGFVVSVIDSASSASLLKGSRGVKKIVCLPSLRSYPPATNPISAMEHWSRARPTW